MDQATEIEQMAFASTRRVSLKKLDNMKIDNMTIDKWDGVMPSANDRSNFNSKAMLSPKADGLRSKESL